METVSCPLIHTDIDDATCYDISMHVEGIGPTNAFPPGVNTDDLDFDVCLNCPYHPQ